MLQIQKKQKYNLLFLKRIILIKSLIAIFAIGLFAFDTESKSIYLSNDKNKKAPEVGGFFVITGLISQLIS